MFYLEQIIIWRKHEKQDIARPRRLIQRPSGMLQTGKRPNGRGNHSRQSQGGIAHADAVPSPNPSTRLHPARQQRENRRPHGWQYRCVESEGRRPRQSRRHPFPDGSNQFAEPSPYRGTESESRTREQDDGGGGFENRQDQSGESAIGL